MPPAKVFFIGADGTMPKVRVQCNLLQGKPQPGQQFDWSVTLVLDPAGVPHAVGRTTTHSPLRSTTTSPVFDIPFTQVRGGTLTVTVKTMVGGKPVSATVKAGVLGTNPTSAAVRNAGAPEILMKLMAFESTFRQFLSKGTKAGYPLFSQDNLGGVGLGQITRPRPTDDQVWDWRANVHAALGLFREKQSAARHNLDRYPDSTDFKTKVLEYNKLRMENKLGGAGVAKPDTTAAAVTSGAAAKPTAPLAPLTITLPPYTNDMLDDETLRLYNGEPGAVREYVALDQSGVLVVKVSEDNQHGEAQWHEVTASERTARYTDLGIPKKRWGDPDYVRHVRDEVVP